MDSFELNKIMGAILGTLLFVMGVGFLAEAIYHPAASGPVYALPVPEGGGEGDNGGTAAPAVSIAVLLASADAAQGEASAKKCQACHDLSTANANKTGPGLYDIVERVIGSHPGFAYSAVMADHQAKGDIWSYENLDHFLITPKGFAPGTKMTFAGVKNDQERANIIAFLATLSASPKPYPTPEATAPADASSEAAAPSEQPVEAEAPAANQVVETPTGTNTSAEDAPATGAMTDTPAAAGGDQASQPASETTAPSSAIESSASEPSSAAQ